MTREFPEADVIGYSHLKAAMGNHEKDRHVAAVAVKAGAQVIVTANLKDFAALPEGVEALSPDEFLENLLDLHPDAFVELLRDQAADLTNPSVTFEELLMRLARVVPGADRGGQQPSRPVGTLPRRHAAAIRLGAKAREVSRALA